MPKQFLTLPDPATIVSKADRVGPGYGQDLEFTDSLGYYQLATTFGRQGRISHEWPAAFNERRLPRSCHTVTCVLPILIIFRR